MKAKILGGGGTLNVEVIGMLVGNMFWKTLKNTSDFDFIALKIPKLPEQLQILRQKYKFY